MIPRDSHCGGVPYETRHVASECGPAPFRKQRLAKMLARGGVAITYNEHLNQNGATVFEHACRLGLEGIVSKRLDAPYRSGPSKTWLKSKNPLSEAVRREREEDWS
jgi:bifunctional non-homologous end joining protein LigD